ncbi:transcriptional regulator NrdR [Candidatus Phycosocius spiralis]|uniref:Transcriptional repressor NrdR n=1 Tax=Candidatus Phycosocius spiralis TaxID=2815099 RepID=A0ABQ4PSC0_9PROT|nr:transcriptional regulator NrdR [Candidatus Phycosocius spiralis]GIU65892.1 transcriptional repressor NrdR [Candidatus Phycosocius spiralis]
MRCPYCGFADTQVKDSRPAEDGASIRRRRQCPACEGRFTTFERVQLRELKVIKRDGVRELFDRDKLQRSVTIALRKRDVPEERIDHLVSGIVRRLETSGENEISTSTVGQYVLDALGETDPVAFVRYASVYRDFREAEDFNRFVDDELTALKTNLHNRPSLKDE